MLARLATFTVRRRRAILITTLVLFLVAAAYGGNVATRLSSGGFDNPSSDSSQAQRLLDHRFHTGSPNLVLLVGAGGATVDDPRVVAAGRAITAKLAAEPGVADVASYWSLGNAAPLRSRDARQALVVARITGTDKQVSERIKQLQPIYARSFEGMSVRVGGIAEVFRQVGTTTEHDLQVAEMIALPITLLLLLFIFRGLVAAALPLVIGAISIVGTFTVLKVMTELTNVSVFALNLTTALGLGLAIDYSLFVVSRFREERAAGFEPDIAVQRTVRAAGRTVAFSAFTVAVSLSVLLVFPTAFLRSFAYAGVAVGIIAGLASVVVLPALLGGLGDKVDALAVRRHAPAPARGRRVAPRRLVRDAPADPGGAGRDRPAGGAGQPVHPDHPGPVRRPGAADVGLEPAGERRAAHPVQQQRDQRAARGGGVHRGRRYRRGRDGGHRPLRHRAVGDRRGGPRRCRGPASTPTAPSWRARDRPPSGSPAPGPPGSRWFPRLTPSRPPASNSCTTSVTPRLPSW